MREHIQETILISYTKSDYCCIPGFLFLTLLLSKLGAY